MSNTLLQTIIAVATFASSVGVSGFIAGMRWGTVSRDLTSMRDRLSKIEGMFTMKLKD